MSAGCDFFGLVRFVRVVLCGLFFFFFAKRRSEVGVCYVLTVSS